MQLQADQSLNYISLCIGQETLTKPRVILVLLLAGYSITQDTLSNTGDKEQATDWLEGFRH